MELFGKEMTPEEALDTLFDSNASKGACKKAAKVLDGVHMPYHLQRIGVILGNIREVYNKGGAAERAY